MSQVFPFRYIGDQMGLGCQGFQSGRSTQPMGARSHDIWRKRGPARSNQLIRPKTAKMALFPLSKTVNLVNNFVPNRVS